MVAFKKIIGKIHLWLGLAAGIIVFIVSITGAILVFEHEIEGLFPALHVDDGRQLAVQHGRLLKPSELSAVLRKKNPEIISWGVNYHKGYSSFVWGWLGGEEGHEMTIFVNPYTGEEIINRGSEKEEKLRGVDHFFNFMLTGHLHLWLPEGIGKPLVDYGTLIFFVMLITGIILWWPRNKAARKQRLRFRWRPTTRWRRKNYDLHNILGFYTTWIAVFLAITGLVMAFDWFAKGWYFTLSGGHQSEFHKPVNHKPIVGDPLDILWERFFTQYPDFAGWIEFYYPETEDEPIMYRCDPYPGRKEAEVRTFNPYTLEEAGKDSPFAYAVLDANYSIHVGEIGGLPTKVLAFFASLIAATLPITGFYIWWGRRDKAKASQNMKATGVLRPAHDS